MDESNDFTWEAGLRVQQKHMEHWKRLLRPEFYDRLVEQVNTLTQRAIILQGRRNGYDVPRGVEISTIVCNLK